MKIFEIIVLTFAIFISYRAIGDYIGGITQTIEQHRFDTFSPLFASILWAIYIVLF